MPRKNFYISETDEKEVYQKAKELAGDSMSSIIVDALKQYIYSKETLAREMGPIVIFGGEVDHKLNVSKGTNSQFTGKEIARHSEMNKSGFQMSYKLYFTLKGKFLVWISALDTKTDIETCTRFVLDSMRDLSEREFPSELISQAVKNMPEVTYEELDI